MFTKQPPFDKIDLNNTTMHYVKSIWTQNGESSSEQVVTYSELGPDRWETRKIEFFPNGQVGIATQAFETADPDVGLAEVAYPELEEINANSDESDVFEAHSTLR